MDVRVELGERSYSIHIERGLLDSVGQRMKSIGLKGKASVVTNPLVGGLYGERLCKGLAEAGFAPVVVTIPDGEEYKSLAEVSKVYNALVDGRFERGSTIVALGGGVVGDLAGFVAATYLRGVPFVQVPTTLLSQVDSSVGGKTGVNHPRGKNLIGAFYQPKAVYIDPEVLRTLEAREVRAGLAEVVKYGVIRDEAFFSFLEASSGRLLELGDEIIEAIGRSCAIKAEVVAMDEREDGLRAILNYGHTFGHAIEALSGYGRYRHGEAVAIGMVMAAALSERLGLLAPGVAGRVAALVNALGMETRPPEIKADDYISALRLDKKVSAARIRFILPTRIGSVELKEIGEDIIREFLASWP